MGGGFPILKYRVLASILRKGGARFLGYGSRTSHRIWAYNVAGRDVQAVIPAHDDGSEVLPAYVRKLRREWHLTEAHGVSDSDFLAGEWGRKQG